MNASNVYEIELWSNNGTPVADISRLAHNRRLELTRNDAPQLTFDLDLKVFEDFCAGQGITDPRTILHPLQADVKLKRADAYWKGFQVVGLRFGLPAGGARAGVGGSINQTVTVLCSGYLNLFAARYVTKSYTATDECDIAEDLITTTQAQTNGSVGVTIAGGNYNTGVLRNRTYDRQNVKRALQNLTQLVDGRFDFDFTYDKQFKTYEQIGSKRTDFALTYGGSASNIAGFDLERNGLSVYNRIIALGSGFGTDQLTSTADDSASQISNYLREDIRQHNSVTDQPPLDDDADADLALSKDLLEIPVITITGKELENIPFLEVGDRVPISVSGHPFLANIDGLYRIERMVIDIDDNDFENSIKLYFDNYAVDQDE